MNNLIRTIKTTFLENSPESVLTRNVASLKPVDIIDQDSFVSYLTHKEPLCNNNEEAGIIYQNMMESIRSSQGAALGIASARDLLKLPLIFTKEKDVLRMYNHQPVCRYEQFLNWRMLSFKIGEDILTSAFIADKEFAVPYDRQIFDWKLLISNDNERLSSILSNGISENHYHLKGSAPHFDLSWLSLMNVVIDRDDEIAKLKKSWKKLYPQLEIQAGSSVLFNMEEKLVIAAAIRYYFYLKFAISKGTFSKNELDEASEWLDKSINVLLKPSKTPFDFQLFKLELSGRINSLKAQLLINIKTSGSPLIFEKWQSADYFISFPSKVEAYEYWAKDKEEEPYKGNRILSGERRYQYLVFKDLYNDTLSEQEASWFYAYQLIKIQFRSEFVQINDHVGFHNFAMYQNRKTYFIKKNSIYEEGLYNLAINSVLTDEYVKNLECRIGPENSASDYSKEISMIDKYVSNKLFYGNQDALDSIKTNSRVDDKYFYTVHFIKLEDEIVKKEKTKRTEIQALSKVSWQCRNYEVRSSVEKQAKALGMLRKASTKTAHRILGIDAANFEIGCRPEVFAHAFRYLRSKQTSEQAYLFGKEVNDRIGVTIHAGEDFIDVIDGLRAIAEAIRFLELSQGDRIGHALALGIDPIEYYESKAWELPTRKQDALDNCVWLFAMLRKYGIVTVKLHEHLRKLIMDLASMIYGNKLNILTITPELLYDAWKLRGDNPELYLDYKNHDFSKGMHGIEIKKPLAVHPWDSFGSGFLESDEKSLRDRLEVGYLNYLYHYDYDTKMNGYQTYTMRVDKEYAEVVDKIQYSIQKEVSRRNIGIETNPSSNYVIGNFKRYAKHPILRFNNHGISDYSYKEQKNLQLFVSINTDDQGVFGTYLENEYALMALALEKEKDEQGNPKYTKTQIYEWIDKVREMGNEQSFINRIRRTR